MDIAEALMTITKNALLRIAAERDIKFSMAEVSEKFNQTYRERFKQIIEETKRDGNTADIFGNLNNGRIDPLVKTSAKISITHGCTQYACELLGVPMIEDNKS